MRDDDRTRATDALEELWALHRAYDEDPTSERWQAVLSRARELNADPVTAVGVERYEEERDEAANARGFW